MDGDEHVHCQSGARRHLRVCRRPAAVSLLPTDRRLDLRAVSVPRLPAVIRRRRLHVVAEPHDDRHRPLHPRAAPDGEEDDGVDGARPRRRHHCVRCHHRRTHRHVLTLRRHR